jgi:hypothetical protein
MNKLSLLFVVILLLSYVNTKKFKNTIKKQEPTTTSGAMTRLSEALIDAPLENDGEQETQEVADTYTETEEVEDTFTDMDEQTEFPDYMSADDIEDMYEPETIEDNYPDAAMKCDEIESEKDYNHCIDGACAGNDGTFCTGHKEIRNNEKKLQAKQKNLPCGKIDRIMEPEAHNKCLTKYCGGEKTKKTPLCVNFFAEALIEKLWQGCDKESCVAKKCANKKMSQVPYCQDLIRMKLYTTCDKKTDFDGCLVEECAKKIFKGTQFCKEEQMNILEDKIALCYPDPDNKKEVESYDDDQINGCLEDMCSQEGNKSAETCKNLKNIQLENKIYDTCSKNIDPDAWNNCINTNCQGKNIPVCLDYQINQKCEKADNYYECIQLECILPKYFKTDTCYDLYNEDEIIEAEVEPMENEEEYFESDVNNAETAAMTGLENTDMEPATTDLENTDIVPATTESGPM